jgi:transposase
VIDDLGTRADLDEAPVARAASMPPYCPDANRIERVWQDFHADGTRNHRCKTMKHLLHNAREYLGRYVWRRVTGFGPTISRAP